MSTSSSLARRTGQRFSPPPQYDSCAPQLGYLSESIHRLLTERECAIFDRGLADYHRRRNIKAFVECLSLVLNTNHKRQLLIPVRDTYVKPSDISRFNQLVQAHGIATSLKRKKKEEEKPKVGEGVKKIEVKRDSNGEWGFDIRGGSEHGIGIFVSWVEPGSSAHKNNLQIGDQILKASETNFESISHYEAVQVMKSSKKLQLWVLSHGRVPGSRMAHKVYRWVDPEGRPTSPPLDPFEIMEQKARGVLNEADERKVTLMVDSGRELGLSIRGGAEHGLGIYISQVEEGSVAAIHGLKAGDQIMEVNGINCINIVHADAANALRAQPCMVMKLKDVGKLPHSKITTYGQTQWYHSPSATITRGARNQVQDSPAFSHGAGTQVMLKKQDPAIQGRGTMKEMARSLLTAQELSTLNYYISQYERHGLSVEDLVTPLLDLLNTPEKLQLLAEVRGILKARDLNRFNELTVHREIAAKKAVKRMGGSSSVEGSQSRLNEGRTMLTKFALQPSHALQTTAQLHYDEPDARQLSPPMPAELSLSAGERTLTPRTAEYGDTSSEEGEGGGRDRVPQRLSPPYPKPNPPIFHAPPPPSTPPQARITSTPAGSQSPNPKQILATTLKDRRQWTRPSAREQSMEEEETWEGQWSFSSIQSPQGRGLEEVDSPAISEIEARVRMETEAKLRKEFEEKEQRIMEEQQRLLEEEQQQKARALQEERKALERQMREAEERTKQELEARIRREAEEEMRRQLAQREREIAEEQEQRMLEEQHRREELEREALEKEIRQAEERTKQELEEKIWKEAEEHIRLEFEARMQQEKEQVTRQATQKHRVDEQAIQKAQERARREAEEKYRVEFEQKLQREMQKKKREEDAERRRREEEEQQRREAEIARLEAEEQARIEQEERIRAEVEAKVRAEYEARLQRETEERARLATEVKARKAAEERMEQQRQEREEAEQRRKQEANVQRAAEERMAQQRREREEAEQRRKQVKAPLTAAERMEQQQRNKDEAEQQRMQEEQHRIHAAHEEEERRREEEQRQAEEEEERKKEAERKRRQELERKREENIRKREEERKQKELEQRKKGKGKLRKQEEEQRKQEEEEERWQQQEAEEEERRRQEAEQYKQREAERKEIEQRKQREAERKAAHNVQQVRVKFGDNGERPKRLGKSRGQLIEDERKRAEEKLQRRLEREKIRRTSAEKVTSTPQETERDAQQESDTQPTLEFKGATGSGPPSIKPPNANDRLLPNDNEKSFGGYTNLHGEILTVTITKVCKKLGIAIDGGANTKQKAVIIREISPGGCAALTGTGLQVGQQILQVSGTNLSGLKHKEVVMTIKSAFEGPLNKTLEFVVLEREDDE